MRTRPVAVQLLSIVFGLGLQAPARQDAGITAPPALDPRIYDIVAAVSADRIESDIARLVGFGTRNTARAGTRAWWRFRPRSSSDGDKVKRASDRCDRRRGMIQGTLSRG